MNHLPLTGLTLIGVIMTGCAAAPATQTFTHTPANPNKINNSIVVNKPFDQAWNDMVKNMTVSQYRINNIEKASRIINLDYQTDSTDDIEKYIDCGSNLREIKYKDKIRSFSYSFSNTNKNEYVRKNNGYHYWYDIFPSLSMTGTVNIYMAPLNEQQTEISINARYEVRRSFTGDYYSYRNSGEYLRKGKHTIKPVKFTVTTKQPALYATTSNESVYCYSTGVIESQFLTFAK